MLWKSLRDRKTWNWCWILFKCIFTTYCYFSLDLLLWFIVLIKVSIINHCCLIIWRDALHTVKFSFLIQLQNRILHSQLKERFQRMFYDMLSVVNFITSAGYTSLPVPNFSTLKIYKIIIIKNFKFTNFTFYLFWN